MTRRKRSLFLCLSLVLSLSLLMLAGCHKDSPTDIVSIFVGGQCFLATNTIVCRDASRSEPQNRLTVVDWELIRSSTGLSQGVLPSAPGGQIAFTALAPGSYQVNQKVSAQNGSQQEKTYGPLIVVTLASVTSEPLL